MKSAGFVLVGGKSGRMGRNKALLPIDGTALAARVATLVKTAAGSATLIGNPTIYLGLGFPVIPDRYPDIGPLAGIEAALFHTEADWNLIAACDLPSLNPSTLTRLIEIAGNSANIECIIPESEGGRLEPMCAVYHRSCRDAIERAILAGVRKVTEGLGGLNLLRYPVPDREMFRNLNSPKDFEEFLHRR